MSNWHKNLCFYAYVLCFFNFRNAPLLYLYNKKTRGGGWFRELIINGEGMNNGGRPHTGKLLKTSETWWWCWQTHTIDDTYFLKMEVTHESLSTTSLYLYNKKESKTLGKVVSIFSTESHGSCSPRQLSDAQAMVCNRTEIQTCHPGILGLRDALRSQTLVTIPYETQPLQVVQNATQNSTNAQESSSMP